MESSKIKFVPYRPKTPPPGWKCPKRFKLGLGSPWESSDSEEDSETEMDELLLMASQRYEESQCCEAKLDKQNGSVNTRKSDWTLQETKNIVLKTPFLQCEQHSDEKGLTAEIDELLLMASQQYEEGNGPKSVVQVRKGKYGKNGGKHGKRSSYNKSYQIYLKLLE